MKGRKGGQCWSAVARIANTKTFSNRFLVAVSVTVITIKTSFHQYSKT